MKQESKNVYKDEDDLKARIKSALSGVDVQPQEPGAVQPRALNLLHPFKAAHDLGTLQNVETQANAFLRGTPARFLASSPLDRAGLYYGLTLAFLDESNDLHTVEVDMARQGTPLQFENALIGVAEQMAKDFAEQYAEVAPKIEPVVTPAPKPDVATPAKAISPKPLIIPPTEPAK